MRPGSGTITEEGKLMFNTIISRTADGRILLATTMFTCLLAVGCLALSADAQAAGDNAATRDLTVEQTSIFSIQAPAPADPAPGRLNVVAWVDHADNTYAIGEKVRLFVRSSKDAYLMVLNIGPTGNTTLLFPNAFQKDARIGANRTVEIPAPGSGAGIRVSGPAVGRELIKVIASSEPLPVFEAAGMTSASPFAVIGAGARSVARDLQVTMDAGTSREWDDYNKVITTVASRPFGRGIAGDSTGHRRLARGGLGFPDRHRQVPISAGRTGHDLRQHRGALLSDAGQHRLVGQDPGIAAQCRASAEPASGWTDDDVSRSGIGAGG